MWPETDKNKYYYMVSRLGYLHIIKDSRTYYVSQNKVINNNKHSEFLILKIKNKSIINMINTNRHHTSKEIFNILVENDVNIVLNKYYDRNIEFVKI